MSKTILVTGATSKTGRYLVPALLEAGETVRAGTRNPPLATALDGTEVERVPFDYDDPDTYGPALEGVDRVFVIARSGDANPHLSINPFIDAIAAEGDIKVVLMTAKGVDADDSIPLRRAERHLEASGLTGVVLRPTWFNQNFDLGWIGDSIRESGGIFLPTADAKSAFIDSRDIAAVGVKALTSDAFNGKALSLTGPEALTYTEAAAIIAEASGRAVTYTAITEEAARDGMLESGTSEEVVAYMLRIFGNVREGHAADITNEVEQVSGRPATTFAQFAADFADAWK